MMQFEFPFESIWGIIYLFLLAIILAIQVFYISTSKRLSPSRKAVRLLLNLFFLLSIGMLVLRPFSEQELVAQRVLVHDGKYSSEQAREWQDSLGLEKAFAIDQYSRQGDEVFLLGNHFDLEDLAKLQPSHLQWLEDQPTEAILDLQWEGIIRQGKTQTVHGFIRTAEASEISLHLGAEKLDSALLDVGEQEFRLRSQAKASGRNELSLRLNGEEIGLVRFFALENAPIHYSLLFTYPDMEIRRLAQWLGQQGEHLSSSIQTSAEARQRAATSGDTAQFYITEPSLLNSPAIREAREKGATILFTNFSQPEAEIAQLNRTLGSNFQLNRNTAEGNRRIDEHLTSLPYIFLSRPNQWELFEGAVAYQELGEIRVGVSLLETTFPIAFQGDTARYGEIWEEIFSAMRPVEGLQVNMMQPIFTNQLTDFQLNTEDMDLAQIKINEDTIFLSTSTINPHLKTGKWIPKEEGWISFGDSLEVFVHGEEFSYVNQKRLINQFMRQQNSLKPSQVLKTEKSFLSSWWLFGLVVFSATLMWVEPRVKQ